VLPGSRLAGRQKNSHTCALLNPARALDAYNHRSMLRPCWLERLSVFPLIIVESALFISSAFAQTAPAAAAGGSDMMSTLTGMLPLVLMFVVLYFVMIRPQMRKQKEHRLMIEALAKGDEVATAGGLLGKVTRLGEGYLTLEIAPGIEVQLQRSAIVQVLPKGAINSAK
jgi:preprotein translocase subunit YajC